MECVLRKLRELWNSKKSITIRLNSPVLQMLYYSMIQSHFSYCISTWCNGKRTTLLKLQRVANKFIRMIHNLDYRASVKEVMHSNGYLQLSSFSHLAFCLDIKIIAYLLRFQIYLNKITCAQKLFQK